MADRGDFAIPHQAIPMGDGNLKIVMPEEIEKYFQAQKLKHSFNKKLGNIKMYGEKALEILSVGTLSYDFRGRTK